MEKYLIVNADDFGASTGVNRGILECHTRGVVTSTSLIVTGQAVHEAVGLSRDHPELAVGLHVDACGEDEREFDTPDVAAVRDEFLRQLDVEAHPFRTATTCGSRGGEFTVAKDQNTRLRGGWFSDRSACYLAAGRPVVTQDTGFDRPLPTGGRAVRLQHVGPDPGRLRCRPFRPPAARAGHRRRVFPRRNRAGQTAH